LGPRFGATYTPHFTILSDCGTEKAIALGELGERVLERILRFAPKLGLDAAPPRHRMAVLYFDDWREYETRARAAGIANAAIAPGYFDERSRRCVMGEYSNSPPVLARRREIEASRRRIERQAAEGDDVREASRRILIREAQIKVGEENIHRTVFRHELAHQVLAEYGLERGTPRLRTWLHEGLAMQFETDDMPNGFRRLDYLQAPRGSRSVPMREVVADARVLAPDHDDSAQAYASAWALVYFLCETRPRALGAFLQGPTESGQAAGALAEFEAQFGALDGEFERAVRRVIEGSR
jgi:hypothetical protein